MINLEPRNLIKFGNSSYVISVPKEWVERNKLKKGDSVFIEQNGNQELIIFPQIKEYKEPNKEIVIDVTGKDIEIIKREIISSYLNNYKITKIKGKDLRNRKEDIDEILSGLVASEIIDENNSEIIIKDFLDIKDVNIHMLLRKVDNLTRSMIYDLKNYKNERNMDDVIKRDKEINKLLFLIIRTLKHSFDDPLTLKSLNLPEHNQLLILWDLSMTIEKIGDELKRVARRFKRLKCEKETFIELIQISNKIEKFYTDTMKSYYNNDKNLALSLSTCKKEIANYCNTLSEKYWRIKGVPEILENYKDITASVHNMARKIYQN